MSAASSVGPAPGFEAVKRKLDDLLRSKDAEVQRQREFLLAQPSLLIPPAIEGLANEVTAGRNPFIQVTGARRFRDVAMLRFPIAEQLVDGVSDFEPLPDSLWEELASAYEEALLDALELQFPGEVETSGVATDGSQDEQFFYVLISNGPLAEHPGLELLAPGEPVALRWV